MRIALIRDGVVINVIEADADFVPDDGLRAILCETAGPGWSYADDAFSAPPESPCVPDSVSMFQAREALRRTSNGSGGTLLDDVGAFIEAQRLDQPTLALAFEYATEVERDGDFVTTLAAQFHLDDARLDALFRLAATIQA